MFLGVLLDFCDLVCFIDYIFIYIYRFYVKVMGKLYLLILFIEDLVYIKFYKDFF